MIAREKKAALVAEIVGNTIRYQNGKDITKTKYLAKKIGVIGDRVHVICQMEKATK